MEPTPTPSPAPELVAFLEELPEPHIVLDAHYRILAANAAYRHKFGAAAGVLGRPCYEVSHHFSEPCDQAGESCPLAQARTSGTRARVLHLHHTPGGEEYVQIELAPVSGSAAQPRLFVEKMAALPVAQVQPAVQGLVGRAPAFQQMLALLARVASAPAAVLLLGETGTGKELAARALHQASPRAQRAWVPVDCSSLPETLFESELFGHERGAFTGATHARPGLVDAANGGTLFLDEVGDIPLAMQVKLLRLLESGTYRRVGSTELRQADIRVVSATHRDLPRMVAEGRFREDLFYRLSSFPIRLPPLRERREDIPLLAQALLERVAAPRKLRLSENALALLQAQPFPGNVRELRNLLERAALLCDGAALEAAHVQQALACGLVPPAHSSAPTSAPVPAALVPAAPAPALPPATWPAPRSAQDWAQLIAEHTGPRAELAARLGISERTLYRRLRALRGSGRPAA